MSNFPALGSNGSRPPGVQIHTIHLILFKTGLSGFPDIRPISDAGNFGEGQLDFMANNKDILYAQRGVYEEGAGATKYSRNVWKYTPLNLNSLATRKSETWNAWSSVD